jgi:hypothetical protein
MRIFRNKQTKELVQLTVIDEERKNRELWEELINLGGTIK